MKFLQLLEQFLFEDRKIDNIIKRQGVKLEKAFKRDRTYQARNVDRVPELKAAMRKAKPADINAGLSNEERILFALQWVHPKYLQWLANRYINREFKFEDLPQIKEKLKEFDRVKAKLPIKDINRYKTMAVFYDALESMEEVDIRSNKQKERDMKKKFFKSGDAKIFYKDSDITIIIPKTEETACFFGKGTQWCTAASGYNAFSSYDSQGDLYIIILSDGDKYQFHFESMQFMDARDQEIPVGDFIDENPSLLKAFGKDIYERIPLIASVEALDGDTWNVLFEKRLRKKLPHKKIDNHELVVKTWTSLFDFAADQLFEKTLNLINYADDNGYQSFQSLFLHGGHADKEGIANLMPEEAAWEIIEEANEVTEDRYNSENYQTNIIHILEDFSDVRRICIDHIEGYEVYQPAVDAIIEYLDDMVSSEKIIDENTLRYVYFSVENPQMNVLESEYAMRFEISMAYQALNGLGAGEDWDDETTFDYLMTDGDEWTEDDDLKEPEDFKDEVDFFEDDIVQKILKAINK